MYKYVCLYKSYKGKIRWWCYSQWDFWKEKLALVLGQQLLVTHTCRQHESLLAHPAGNGAVWAPTWASAQGSLLLPLAPTNPVTAEVGNLSSGFLPENLLVTSRLSTARHPCSWHQAALCRCPTPLFTGRGGAPFGPSRTTQGFIPPHSRTRSWRQTSRKQAGWFVCSLKASA